MTQNDPFGVHKAFAMPKLPGMANLKPKVQNGLGAAKTRMAGVMAKPAVAGAMGGAQAKGAAVGGAMKAGGVRAGLLKPTGGITTRGGVAAGGTALGGGAVAGAATTEKPKQPKQFGKSASPFGVTHD